MSTRHDILTSEDFVAHQVRKEILHWIDQHLESLGPLSDKRHINILDWGCGRGASVGKLLYQGFNAYGVEIDRKVLQKGYPLLRERGYDPCKIIMHVEETRRFPDGFFHIIFSEEVLEHVEHIDVVAREMSRLTRAGGSGIHLFQGSRGVLESHLLMPFVHWLPKSSKRQIAIAAFLLLRIGPKWPGVDELGVWKASQEYCSFLDEHTHYRDIRLILKGFRSADFGVAYEISYGSRTNRWAPDCLRRNGFPGGGITLFTSKSPA